MKRTQHEECPIMRLTIELMIDIMLRLPDNETIGKCILVCKTWYEIILSYQFSIEHLQFCNETSDTLTLALHPDNAISTLGYMDDSRKDITKGVGLVELQREKWDDYFAYIVGSCDGLVCVYLRSKLMSFKNLMYLWNPLTKKREEIVLPNERGEVILHEDACWFGYLPTLEEYKIFISYYVCKPEFRGRMYVYSFLDETWREICVTDQVSRCFVLGLETVFVNEVLHCLNESRVICMFNVVKETFETMPSWVGEPYLSQEGRDIMSLGVMGGSDDCLCVMFVECAVNGASRTCNEGVLTLEVWMQQDYYDLNSWERWCKIDLQPGIYRYDMKFLGFTYYGILIFQDECGLRLIDPRKNPPSCAIAMRNASCNKVYKVVDYMESFYDPYDFCCMQELL